jgi:hypothetical protein
MKHGKSSRFPVLVMALAGLLAAASLALAQDDVMFLQSEALGDRQRPTVRFPHTAHAESIECRTCHHDFDAFYNNLGPVEAACADCHQPEPTQDNRVGLRQAFHTGCQGCHRGMRARGEPSGPVTCGGCHDRQAAAGATGGE